MTSSRHGFSQSDLDRLRLVQSADLSPDARWAVYALFTTDPEEGRDHCALWLADVDGGGTRQLTAGTGKDTSPAFSPDGTRVAFVSDRTGTAQIHVIPVGGGEAAQVTTLARGVAGPPAWSPDGALIAFAAGPQGEPRDTSAPYRVTRTIYRFDALGWVDDIKRDVYVVPAEGGEARRLTDDDCVNEAPLWEPNGRGLIYLSWLGPDSAAPWPRLRRVDLRGAVRDVPHPGGFCTGAGFAPDGRLVVQVTFHGDRPIGSSSELYVGDVVTGLFERRTSTLQGQVGGGFQGDLPSGAAVPRLGFLPDGRVVTSVQAGGAAPLHGIALSGPESFSQLTSGPGACVPLASVLGRVLYLASDFDEPGDLHVLEEGEVRRLTRLNQDVLAGVELPEVREVVAAGTDGARVEGWFLAPRSGRAPYPTVLYIHGGPHGAFGHAFHADQQLLAGAGYGVLLVNHRGSTGYGDEFGNAAVGDWGVLDYGDLMAGVDRAIELGLADADRMGVCGLSGGGNLTCWIVGHTDRFRAAVPENPVTNFVSMFGVQDIGIWFAQAETGGKPQNALETYLRMSPITYAHRCRTPTLLVQGESDMRCPPEQSEQFYAALKLAGCPVEMLRLPGVPHGGSIVGPLQIRRAQNEALVEWIDRWVRGAAPAAGVADVAPGRMRS